MLRPDQVRARIAAALEGLVLATGTQGTLREAPCGFDALPAGVSDQRLHLAFGVKLARDMVVPEQRQRQGRPLRVASEVSVQLLHKRRETDAVADEAASLAAEHEARVAVLGVSGADGLQVTYQGTGRRESAPDHFSSTLDFLATYHVATT